MLLTLLLHPLFSPANVHLQLYIATASTFPPAETTSPPPIPPSCNKNTEFVLEVLAHRSALAYGAATATATSVAKGYDGFKDLAGRRAADAEREEALGVVKGSSPEPPRHRGPLGRLMGGEGPGRGGGAGGRKARGLCCDAQSWLLHRCKAGAGVAHTESMVQHRPQPCLMVVHCVW